MVVGSSVLYGGVCEWLRDRLFFIIECVNGCRIVCTL